MIVLEEAQVHVFSSLLLSRMEGMPEEILKLALIIMAKKTLVTKNRASVVLKYGRKHE